MSTSIILNDRPYSDGQEDPFRSLGDTLAFSVDDWGHTRAMAWVWGIICGWDDEAMAELAEQHGWDENTAARLNRLHSAFEARATPEEPAVIDVELNRARMALHRLTEAAEALEARSRRSEGEFEVWHEQRELSDAAKHARSVLLGEVK